jgi:hypothetical protein
VTVACVDVPPRTLLEVSTREVRARGGLFVSVAVFEEPLNAAVMTEVAVAVTAGAETVNVAAVCPAGTTTVAGTVAADVLPLVSVTVSPPAAAALVSVTVAVVVTPVPPVTLVGESTREATVGAWTVNVAVGEEPLKVAWMVAVVLLATATVPMLNCALVWPAGTVTVAGTVAALLLLESVTPSPPAAAALDKVTVPVTPVPPTVVLLLSATELTMGAVIFAVAVCEELLKLAVMVAVTVEVTGAVVTVKPTLVAPAGTVTVAGTWAAALLLESVTASPPVAAGPERVTVPDKFAPPGVAEGDIVTDDTVGGLTDSAAVLATP